MDLHPISKKDTFISDAWAMFLHKVLWDISKKLLRECDCTLSQHSTNILHCIYILFQKARSWNLIYEINLFTLLLETIQISGINGFFRNSHQNFYSQYVLSECIFKMVSLCEKLELHCMQKTSLKNPGESVYLHSILFTRFFYKQHFYKQRQTEIGKKLSKS